MIEMEEIINRLVLHEGLKLHTYKCPAGYLSIGVGRNLITNPLTKTEKQVVGDLSQGITYDMAMYLLRHDIKRVLEECRFCFKFWKHLDAERKYALFDMCFNLGLARLLKFKKMLEALEIGDYKGAAKECLNSKYARDVGKRAERIAKTFETGEFEYD